MVRKTKRIIFLLFNVVFLIIILYYFSLYLIDRKILKQYVAELKLEKVIANTTDTYELAISVRDFVLKDINANLATCEFFDFSQRPYCGYRISEIIKHREGQCVEGSRLLINVFSALNIPSRKVYLFGKRMHCVLEVYDGEKWILVDSINSPADFKEFTEEEKKGVKDYFEIGRNRVVVPNEKTKKFGFKDYGYFNWNKIVNNTALGCEVYMHGTILDKFQLILENPSLFFSTIFFTLWCCINIIVLSSIAIKKSISNKIIKKVSRRKPVTVF